MTSRFDGDRAKAHIEAICALGPRPTGSRAMTAQRRLIERYFDHLGLSCLSQRFVFSPRSEPTRKLRGVNLIAKSKGTTQPKILLGAHYDTRPLADEESDPKRRVQPIIGANDGASGVAVLMELARLTVEVDSPTAVDFVFFDAEEYVLDPDLDHLLIGSTYFANHLNDNPDYAAAIILDIVAREGAVFSPDRDSYRLAPRLVEEFFARAENICPESFQYDVRTVVYDDHIPLLHAGIPALVLIDIHDPRWHTLADIPKHCSPSALGKVGNVVWDWICRRSISNL